VQFARLRAAIRHKAVDFVPWSSVAQPLLPGWTMLVDVCTFVGLVILYLVYDWHAMREPAAPATWPGGRDRRRGPLPKVVIRSRRAATRLTLVPGRGRRQPVGDENGRAQQRAG